ncbi:MAG: hypothetical protein ABFR95_07470 [Actinomycetota bacterium]
MMLLLTAIAAPATATSEVPIKGTVMGEHGPPDFGDEACLDAGYLWRFPSAGVGQMSHLGRVEYELTQCTVPGPEGFASVGTVTFTAANGDQLWLEHTMLGQLIGDFDPDPDGFAFEGEWTAVGGTGRFAHATGSGMLHGIGDIPDGETVLDIPDGLAQFNFMGEIAYTASDSSMK